MSSHKSACGKLMTQYLNLATAHSQSITLYNKLLMQTSVSGTQLDTLLAQLPKVEAEFADDYERSVDDLIVQWEERTGQTGGTFQVDTTGRVNYQGDIRLGNLINPYLPALIKKIDGDLSLPQNYTYLDYLEEVETIYFSDFTYGLGVNSDFSAKRLRKAQFLYLGQVREKIDLPELVTCSVLGADIATSLSAPKLKTVEESLSIHGLISLDSLEYVNDLTVLADTKGILNSLSTATVVSIHSEANIVAPMLTQIKSNINQLTWNEPELHLFYIPEYKHFRDYLPALEHVDGTVIIEDERVMAEVTKDPKLTYKDLISKRD